MQSVPTPLVTMPLLPRGTDTDAQHTVAWSMLQLKAPFVTSAKVLLGFGEGAVQELGGRHWCSPFLTYYGHVSPLSNQTYHPTEEELANFEKSAMGFVGQIRVCD